jgi:hypothetical protein
VAFDETLAARIRGRLARRKGVEEKKLFGGLGFLLRGHLLVCVWKNSLMVRVGPDAYEEALREPHVGEFTVTGRPMRNWVLVAPAGIPDDDYLDDWIKRATRFVGKLPPK